MKEDEEYNINKCIANIEEKIDVRRKYMKMEFIFRILMSLSILLAVAVTGVILYKINKDANVVELFTKPHIYTILLIISGIGLIIEKYSIYIINKLYIIEKHSKTIIEDMDNLYKIK